VPLVPGFDIPGLLLVLPAAVVSPEVVAAEGLAEVEDEAVLAEHVSEIIFTESTL